MSHTAHLAHAAHALTYAQLLALFIAPPIVALAALVAWDWRQAVLARGQPSASERRSRRPALATLLALLAAATIYTIPWDDHLIATGVWFYQPSLLAGVFAGHIPLEELLFFPSQTLLIGLWFLWLAPRAQHARARPNGGAGFAWRAVICALGALAWLTAFVILRVGWRPGTYLSWELVWALPPLITQALVGGDILWRRRWLVVGVIAPVALYLCSVDALAIGLGIWTIDPRQSLDVMIGGALPLEEFVFFLVTTALVAFGLVLGTSAEACGRVGLLVTRAWRSAPPARVRARS